MLSAAVVQRSQYVSRRLAENREASNAASARRNNVFRSSRRSGRTGRAQGRSSFGLPDGTGGSQSLNPNLVQWYDEGGGGEDGNGEGDDIASRVVYGLPETTNFSGSSDYPFSNFVDPENEWDEDGAGTHQPEPQQPSEEQDGVFDPAIFFDAESDEEDNGDNWSEKQVENEFRQYWETGKTWKKERVVWLNACVTKRNGLSLKEHDSLNKKAVLFKDLKKKKKEKEEGGGGEACAVCLDTFEEDSLCCLLKCNHSYHRDCLRQWLKKSTSCPYCRGEVTAKSFTAKMKAFMLS